MNIKKVKINGINYFSFTDIHKELSKIKICQTNISYSCSRLPFHFLHRTNGGRGRNSETFITLEGIKLWLSKSRSISQDFREKLENFLEIKKVDVNSFEEYYMTFLESFLKEMMPNIVLQRQALIEGYNVDLLINNKIVVEFNENHHKHNTSKDIVRENNIKNKGYKFINVNSSDAYGKSTADVYKLIKLIFF